MFYKQNVLFVIARGLVLILNYKHPHFDQSISKAFLDNFPVWQFLHAHLLRSINTW